MSGATSTVNKYVRIFVGMILFVLVLLSSVIGETTRPTTLGISLTYPTIGYVAVSRELSANVLYELRVPLTLDIDSAGTVINVQKEFADDTMFVRELDSVLKTVAFIPGLKDGSPVCQKILTDIILYPGRRRAMLRTPVSDSLEIDDAGSYTRALLANGAVMPSIERLAPYFCTLSSTDSLSVLPSILLKIALTENGKPLSIEPLRSSYQAITDQVVSVFNWADYLPAVSAGGQIASEIFVSLVFHPAALYPTRPIGNSRRDSGSIIEQFLLNVYPDTLGLMLPPIPQNIRYDSLAIPEAQKRHYGRVSIGLVVDKAGKAEIGRISAPSRKIYDLTNLALTLVKFYPALGFDGLPRQFIGLAHVDFDGSANVRIHLDWLLLQSQQPIR